MEKSYNIKMCRVDQLASDLRHAVVSMTSYVKISCDDSSGRAVYSIVEMESLNQVRKQVSFLVGDILHNLRCSLDYAAFTEYESNDKAELKENKVYFPVFETKDDFENNRYNIGKISNRFLTILESKIKPYKVGGNEKIWILNRLNNICKHRQMAVVLNRSVGVDISTSIKKSFKEMSPDLDIEDFSLFLKPANGSLEEDKTLFKDAPGSKCNEGYKNKFSINIVEESIGIDEPLVIYILDLIDEIKAVLKNFD